MKRFLQLIILKTNNFSRDLQLNTVLHHQDANITNIRRLYILSLVAIPISFISILSISILAAPETPQEINWNKALIVAHSSLFILMLFFSIISYYLRKNDSPGKFGNLIQLSAIFSILLFGIAITAIDQLVTSNITPFILATIIISAIFLIQPLTAVGIHLTSYIILLIFLGLMPGDRAIILSNSLNGMTAIGVGICLSIAMWRSFVANLEQKSTLIKQKIDLEDKNKELAVLASFDYMTGLINRRQFELISISELARNQEYGHVSCIIITDIDYFKEVNDRFGHPVGDMLLKQVASIFSDNLRNADVVSRWGGDEFIILLPETNLEMGQVVAEKLRTAIENYTFLLNNTILHITASFGVAEMNASFLESYQNADLALYAAKKIERNKVITTNEYFSH